MFFRRYRLLIFTDDGSPHSSLRVWGGVIPVLALLIAAGVAGIFILRDAPVRYAEAMERLDTVETRLLRQRDMLFEIDQRTMRAEAGFSRVMDLNPKLRVMLNFPPQEQANATRPHSPSHNFRGHLAPDIFLKAMMREKQKRLAELYTDLRVEEIHQQQLIHEVSVQKERLTRIPIIWPTHGTMSSQFGYRISPFTGKRAFHQGLDIRAPRGTPIYATANGVITRAEWFSTYGNAVDINHGDGIVTRYGHMYKINVHNGESVTRGQVIGLVGNTGRSQAPHVHYEVHVSDKPVNPINYILR